MKTLSNRVEQLVPLAIFVFASFLAFGAVLPGEFVVDDKLWAATTAPSAEQQTILKTIGGWVFRPLHTFFVHQAHGLLGGNVAAWHGLSIVLHAINAYLVYLLLLRLEQGLPTFGALMLALAFVLHPAGSEAVLWISAMAEVTCAFSLLVSLHCYLRWRESWTATRLLSIALFLLMACLVKETAIVFPAVVILFELGKEKSWRHCMKPVSAMLVAVVVFLVLRQWTLGSSTGGQPLSFNFVRITELALAHLRFLWLPAAPPFALRPPEVALASASAVAVALLILSVVLAAAQYLKASLGVIALGLAWGFLMLWPAFAVAMVGDGFFNGRQAYVASIAIPILLAAVWVRIPVNRMAAGAILWAGVLVWMLYSTVASALVWRTNIGVYSQSMMLSPSAAGPRAGIADSLAQAGKVDEAVEMYSGAAQRATNAKEKAGYLYAMGLLLGQAGRVRESNLYLGQVIELEPLHSYALTGLGNNAWTVGKMAEAEYFYRRAISTNPGNVEAMSNLQRLLAVR